LAAIVAYLEKAHEAALGEGPTILDYAHIMGLVEGLGDGEGRAVLWSILPRFLQGAVDLDQAGQRALTSSRMMRHGYPPVGVPPCTPGIDLVMKKERGVLDVFVDYEEDYNNFAESIYRDSTLSEQGEAFRKGAHGELLLVLEFRPEDIGEWFGKWLDLENMTTRGLSLGVESFSFDLSSVKVESHGWRDKDGEFLIRCDDGYTIFDRVVPVWVKQGEGGSPVAVALLIAGNWKSFSTPDGDGDGDGDVEPVEDDPDPTDDEGFRALAEKFGVSDAGEVDDGTE